MDRLRAEVFAFDPFGLAGLHDLVTISGSLVIGLAVVKGRLGADEAWSLSRIDEAWQEEQWGVDEEAADLAETKRVQFLHADRFFRMATS